MTEELERQIIELMATERIYRPISSMEGKLKRARPKIAKALDLSPYKDNFQGERVYARLEETPGTKARGTSEGVAKFCKKFPRQGTTLLGYIAEQRAIRETNMYFGVNEGRRLTSDDYMGVMKGMGFTEATSNSLYPELMDVSRKLEKKRGDRERSILINTTLGKK